MLTGSVRILALLIAAPLCAGAEILDRDRIHTEYNNGDFDQVEKELEGFRSRNKSYGHDDSVFIAKHLAVVYAANPQTREKGRYFMFRLLELLPSAKIVDMFVSEEIDRIFDKVKEEFLAKQYALGKTPGATAYQTPETIQPAKTPDRQKPVGKKPIQEEESSGAGYWMAGGLGLVAVGAAVYYMLPQEKAPRIRSMSLKNSRVGPAALVFACLAPKSACSQVSFVERCGRSFRGTDNPLHSRPHVAGMAPTPISQWGNVGRYEASNYAFRAKV
jgi:hypothetical protein